MKIPPESIALNKPRPVYLRVSRVAAVLDISRTSVYDLVRRGELQAVKVGARLRIPELALEEMISRNVQK